MFSSVSVDDNEKLLETIQDLEIKEVVFQMDKYKALGPDGRSGKTNPRPKTQNPNQKIRIHI